MKKKELKETELNNNTKPVFYGITPFVAKSMDKFIAMAGEPIVFTGNDQEVQEYENKLFLEKYEVLSFDEVLKKYPENDIWVTYKIANATAKKLLKNYAPEKIHFLKADLEYRKGCGFLGHFIDYRVDNFSPCCVSSKSAIKTSGSIAERMVHWQKSVTQLIDDLKNGRPNACDGCKHLKEGFYPKTVKLDYICFATNHPGDVCNLKCSYCFVQERFKNFRKSKEGLTTYETIRQLAQIPKYDNSDITIELSNGEICVNKYCNEIFDILLNNKWKARFVTNMTVYNEKFAEFMKTGRTVNILTSLDSGTPETYKKIKQVDCLDKVIENIKKYPLENVDFRLKYIFLEGINDNEVDVNGFYDIVKDVNCKAIMLSSDRSKPFTEKMRKLVAELIEKAKKDGIKIYKSSYLATKDEKYIDELVSNETNDNLLETTQSLKLINIDDKKITLNSDLLTDNAKLVIVMGDNSTITINGNIYINTNDKLN